MPLPNTFNTMYIIIQIQKKETKKLKLYKSEHLLWKYQGSVSNMKEYKDKA